LNYPTPSAETVTVASSQDLVPLSVPILRAPSVLPPPLVPTVIPAV
jgi:hypothetical protein